jgi:cell division protein FtsZ
MSEMGMAMMGTGVSQGEDRAREAAESAVSSPLLEDINLAGANGILVNVTAGMDLSIGEFQEVGETIRDFASEDATVVVGTVIDPDLSNTIRVTVVATGLGQPARAAQQPPMRVVRQQQQRERQAAPAPAPAASGSEPNYQDLEKPTIARKRAVGDGLGDGMLQEELLDIPAFLRRQAD